MPRYCLAIEYDGTGFVGWQRQDNGASIQSEIERALAVIHRGQEIALYGAGRTDAGVHAQGQMAHFDTETEWPTNKLRDAINAHLKPHAIAITQAFLVDDEFHARFSATKRHYLYRIKNRRPRPVLDMQLAWWVRPQLDHQAMHDAAQCLVGQHDFTTFRSVQCQAKSPLKTLDELLVRRHGDVVEVTTAARSFMHNQVRSFVGSLVEVGLGRWTRQDLEQALKACDRAACGPVAPPQGLLLTKVDYDGYSMS